FKKSLSTKFPIAKPRSTVSSSFLDQVTAHDEGIHSGTEESADGVGRRADNWLASQVEGCVHYHRHASALAELLNDAPIEWIYTFLHSLRSSTAIDVRDRWDDAPFLRLHRTRKDHKGRVYGSLQVIAGCFREE